MEVAKQASRKDLITQTEQNLELLKAEHRLEQAVSKYGRELKFGMSLKEAYELVAECLEEGARALGK